jgi:hypothetical protein
VIGSSDENADVDRNNGQDDGKEGNWCELGHKADANEHTEEECNEKTCSINAEIVVGIVKLIHWLKYGRLW